VEEFNVENGLRDFTCGDDDNPLFNDVVTQSVHDSLAEAVLNALEHGSDWGSEGEIVTEGTKGKSGLLFQVNQPLSGFTFEQWPKYPPDIDAMTSSAHESGRGHGILRFALDSTPWTWFEQIKEEGFVTRILETRRRLGLST